MKYWWVGSGRMIIKIHNRYLMVSYWCSWTVPNTGRPKEIHLRTGKLKLNEEAAGLSSGQPCISPWHRATAGEITFSHYNMPCIEREPLPTIGEDSKPSDKRLRPPTPTHRHTLKTHNIYNFALPRNHLVLVNETYKLKKNNMAWGLGDEGR